MRQKYCLAYKCVRTTRFGELISAWNGLAPALQVEYKLNKVTRGKSPVLPLFLVSSKNNITESLISISTGYDTILVVKVKESDLIKTNRDIWLPYNVKYREVEKWVESTQNMEFEVDHKRIYKDVKLVVDCYAHAVKPVEVIKKDEGTGLFSGLLSKMVEREKKYRCKFI